MTRCRTCLGCSGIQDSPDPLAQMDPQIRRRRTLEALKRLTLREALEQPVVVIFEDLHWIESQTQALLDLLADSIAELALAAASQLSARNTATNGPTSLYYSQLRLGALAGESADAMLAALLGYVLQLAPLKRLIVESPRGSVLHRRDGAGAVGPRGCPGEQWRGEGDALALADSAAAHGAGYSSPRASTGCRASRATAAADGRGGTRSTVRLSPQTRFRGGSS